jgi:hypothetical protein
MCANEGYLPDQVNFSCRIAKCAKSKEEPVNVIETLKRFADDAPDGLRERLGENFARGHKEASGGIVGKKEFEEFMEVMRIGEKPDKFKGKGPKKETGKQTTLKDFFKVA